MKDHPLKAGRTRQFAAAQPGRPPRGVSARGERFFSSEQAARARHEAARTRYLDRQDALMGAIEHALALPLDPPNVLEQIAAFESAQFEIRRSRLSMLRHNLTRLLLPHSRMWHRAPAWLQTPANLAATSAGDLAHRHRVLEPGEFDAMARQSAQDSGTMEQITLPALPG